MRKQTHVDATSGEPCYEEVRGQQAIAALCKEEYEAHFNHGLQPDADATKTLLDPIRNNTACHLTADQAAQLTPSALFTPDTVYVCVWVIRPGHTGTQITR